MRILPFIIATEKIIFHMLTLFRLVKSIGSHSTLIDMRAFTSDDDVVMIL